MEDLRQYIITKIATCIIRLEILEYGARQSSLLVQQHHVNLEGIAKRLALLEQKTLDNDIM